MRVEYLTNARLNEIGVLAMEFRAITPVMSHAVEELLGHIREQADDIEHYKEQIAKMALSLNRCQCQEETEDDCE